jgi:hypothetical protein
VRRRRIDLEQDTNPNHPCAAAIRTKRSRAVHAARQLSDEAGAAECEKLGLKTSYPTLQDVGTYLNTSFKGRRAGVGGPESAGVAGEAQILTTRGLTGNTAGAKKAKYQAAADQRPMFPPGTTCHGCKCPVQPDSLTLGWNYIHWKRTTCHIAGCKVALMLAKPGHVTITVDQLKKMVPAAAHPAFCTTVKKYQTLMRKTKASEKK